MRKTLKWMIDNAPKTQHIAITVAFGCAIMFQGSTATAQSLRVESTTVMTFQEMEMIKLIKRHSRNPDGTREYPQVRIREAVQQANNKEYVFKDKQSSTDRFMKLVDQKEMTTSVMRLKERKAYGL